MKMQDAIAVEAVVGDKILRFEAGVLAQQASGAVTARMGDTLLFSAISNSQKPREGVDFFPLQVEYREKFYSAGRFPGGYFKREARPSEKEILTMRVTDRPIRPLFPEGYCNDVQINNMVMACDGLQEPDMLSVNASSAALMLSEVPFMGPIGAVRIGRIDGEFVIEPSHEQMAASDLNLVYVGIKEKMMMIEGDADELPEEVMIEAIKVAHQAIQPIIEAQHELRKALGKEPKVIDVPGLNQDLLNKCFELAGDQMNEVMTIGGKHERGAAKKALRIELEEQMQAAFPEMTENEYFIIWDEFEIQTVRRNALDRDLRVDGRRMDEIRPLDSDAGIIPRIHGSALFSRGETQAVATITLGTKKDGQMMDGVTGGPTEKNFLLHYNFPPYSVGEAGRLGMTSRREIGHGNLAERSLKPVMPDDYPYSVRIVSEVMSSNGSTSMASTCAGTLALMDAGVPITRPVAGISVGLYTRGDESKLIIDILGVEDHCGDMDFKVCGTTKGITGFQVDMKIHGMSDEQIEGAFAMAKTGRMEILDAMALTLAEPRPELSAFAPRIETLNIATDKIGALIGPGGKNIRRITEECGVQIDIEEDGTVLIYSTDGPSLDAAVREVNSLCAEAEPGEVYDGVVTGVKDFGAFVEILPGKDGLVHISELDFGRVNKTEDVCQIGDEMRVKVLDVNENGRISLSRKAVLEDEKNEEG